MPKLPLYNQTGESSGTVDTSDKIFGQPKFRTDLVHEVVVAGAANARVARAHTKTRGEVRGGGKKPWRQKGTGRARVGSIRSPLWRGGGIIFGPRNNRNFSRKVNQKTMILAVSNVLSEFAREKRIFVLDKIEISQPKTKELFQKLEALRTKLGLGRKVVIVIPEMQEAMQRAARNIQNVKLVTAKNVNIMDLLSANSVVILKDSLGIMEKRWVF